MGIITLTWPNFQVPMVFVACKPKFFMRVVMLVTSDAGGAKLGCILPLRSSQPSQKGGEAIIWQGI